MMETQNATVQESSNSTPLERLTWMTSAEAARYLRKTVGALHTMVFRGYLRPRKFRRRLYFLRSEIDRMLESSTF